MTEAKAPKEKKTRLVAWMISGKGLLVMLAGVIAFLASALIPLFRKEIAPAIMPNSMVRISAQVIGDYPNYLMKSRKDGTVFLETAVPLAIKVSNRSEFPVNIDDVLVHLTTRSYGKPDPSSWEMNYIYYAGADVTYETFQVYLDGFRTQREIEIRDGFQPAPISAFANAVFSESYNNFDVGKFRKLVYKLPPYETEYILFSLEYPQDLVDRLEDQTLGLLFKYTVYFTIKGRESSVRLDSPVNMLVSSEALTPQLSDSHSENFLAYEEEVFSGYQQQLAAELELAEQEVNERPSSVLEVLGEDPASILGEENMWVIVAGGFQSQEGARRRQSLLEAQGVTGSKLFLRGVLLRVVLVGYPTSSLAREGMASIEWDSDRPYVVNLRDWCPRMVGDVEMGVFHCV